MIQNLIASYQTSITLKSWGSEATPFATPLATHLFKSSYKISHPPWVSLDALPTFAALLKSAKIGQSEFFTSKIIEIFMIFLRKSLGAHIISYFVTSILQPLYY